MEIKFNLSKMTGDERYVLRRLLEELEHPNASTAKAARSLRQLTALRYFGSCSGPGQPLGLLPQPYHVRDDRGGAAAIRISTHS